MPDHGQNCFNGAFRETALLLILRNAHFYSACQFAGFIHWPFTFKKVTNNIHATVTVFSGVNRPCKQTEAGSGVAVEYPDTTKS